MTRSHVRLALATSALLVVGLLGAGCSAKQPAEVTSAWPVANTERVVPEPPIPPTWPLTGMLAPSEAATKRRPLSIKVENTPNARPQTGLNSADVVYETVVEGGITRFNLVFQSKIPKVVGPVRSARLSDLWIVPQYHAIFFYSGSSRIVGPRISSAGLTRLPHASSGYAYYRTSRPAPHNLYLNMPRLAKDVKRHKFKTTVTVPPLQFGPASVATTGTPVRSVYVPLSGYNNVTWTYNKKRDVWLRENGRAVHRDAATGKQVAAKNVVVMWAKYSNAGGDKHGGTTFDIKLGGSGKATVFRNGRRYNAKWTASRDEAPRFVDKKGRPIRLERGNTWFEVIALDVDISMK